MNNDLLIIGFVWPEPTSSAAGSRMLQLIEQFQKQKFNITFASAANTSPNTFDLSTLGISTKAIELNNNSFNAYLSDLNPDIVLFDRFMTEEQYGWRVAETCPDTIRILDTEDFHGLRKARELALNDETELTIEHLQNDISKREIASIYRCDLSLIISEAEMTILTEQFKIDQSLLHYLPFLLDRNDNSAIEKLPAFEERTHFITIGNFLHKPNYDAILHLKQSIWPIIRKALPHTELHVYGAYESPKVTQLNSTKDGFLIKGYAEDVNQIMQNALVCLAPLRFGAGLKGKLIDAMQNGTPCVMSIIAAEGMFGQFDCNGFVEDYAQDFASKATELCTNASLWRLKQQAGFEVLKNRFFKKDFERAFTQRIDHLKTNLNEHRANNFTGKMLMHHTLQSTKYLSKWIEEKNK